MEVLYKAELDFLMRTFEKHRLQVLLVEPYAAQETRPDLGLRYFLGMETDCSLLTEKVMSLIEPNFVYKLTDQFQCTYLFLRLPERETVLTIGPYLTRELTAQQILELAEKNAIQPQYSRPMDAYYAHLPVMTEDSPLYSVLDTFCSVIWGEDAFHMVDVNQEITGQEHRVPHPAEDNDPNQTAWTMQLLEERYAYENELMRAVSQGLTHKVENLMNRFSNIPFESRASDPVRNLKNYAIIMNTLLRKAAEQGGVHPLYLDSTSSEFAHRIERITSASQRDSLLDDMVHAYCRLVNRHATQKYSAPVQKAIIQIDSDLGGNLNLKTLAELQNLNASYLSALFKKETGQTITDFISQKRVRLAMQLLASTDLQVQTIAQHCGILDVNYFSKVFRRHIGKSPKEYRREVRMQMQMQAK